MKEITDFSHQMQDMYVFKKSTVNLCHVYVQLITLIQNISGCAPVNRNSWEGDPECLGSIDVIITLDTSHYLFNMPGTDNGYTFTYLHRLNKDVFEFSNVLLCGL